MQKLVRAVINDFRMIFRDNSLKVFLVLPLLILIVVKYAVPHVTEAYPALQEYISIIVMFATMQGSIAFGFIYSMVFVDEKDTSVAQVYGILPVSKFWFVVGRLVPPFLFATLATFLLLLVEPFYGVPVVSNLFYSILAGLMSPLMVLFVAGIATNKIEAMTWQKLFNLPLFLPVFAFFVPSPFSSVFAPFPTYWAFQAFDSLIDKQAAWPFLLVGIIYSSLLIVFLVTSFTKRHFR